VEHDRLLSTRRSVHEYSDEELDEETLRGIFERVRYSPSGYNLQPWEFLVLREPETKQRLKEAANGQAHVTEAAAAVVVLGNTDPAAHAEAVFDDWLAAGYLPSEEVRDGLVENVEGMAAMDESERRVWTTRSTALAAMTLMTAAWDAGVASCPMEGFDAAAVADGFDVPDGYEPVMLVTLGYAAEGAADVENERKARRPVESFVHHESLSLDDETELSAAPGL
jgi:nitroreductase